MARTTHQPQIISCPPEQRGALFRLRARVWLAEGAAPKAFGADGRWTDARDAERQHWVALHEGEVVAGASLSIHANLREAEEAEAYLAYGLPETGPIAAPARLIVRRDWRGRGLAQKLLEVQEQAARAAGASLAVRQASHMLRPLLERRGWHCHGPAPLDARFPLERFSVMSLSLSSR